MSVKGWLRTRRLTRTTMRTQQATLAELGGMHAWEPDDEADDMAEMLHADLLREHSGATTPTGEGVLLDFPIFQDQAPAPEDIDMDALRLRYRTWSAGGRPGWNGDDAA